MEQKGIGYWDIIKELYNGIVDTKPNGDSSTLKQIWDTTPIGQLQNIIMDSNTKVGSKTTHVTKGILNHINDTGSTIPYISHSINTPDIEDKRMITIQNPEGLNTGDTLLGGEWGITYGGRDLSLDVDNYCWIVTNRRTGTKGYYIVERELVTEDWLYVRWGKDKVSPKERRESINKSRLRDKDKIQMDMIRVIANYKAV